LFVVVIGLFIFFGHSVAVAYKQEAYEKKRDEAITTKCISTCKPYRVLFCDSKHVVCDGLNGGEVISLE